MKTPVYCLLPVLALLGLSSPLKRSATSRSTRTALPRFGFGWAPVRGRPAPAAGGRGSRSHTCVRRAVNRATKRRHRHDEKSPDQRDAEQEYDLDGSEFGMMIRRAKSNANGERGLLVPGMAPQTGACHRPQPRLLRGPNPISDRAIPRRGARQHPPGQPRWISRPEDR